MRLISLELNNFRQYFGHQIIGFTTDDSQNVTVIHGENGSGKTALLNAFKWVLYDEVDFDTGKRHLVSEHAIDISSDKEEIHTYVILEFEHNNNNYRAKREMYSKKDGALSCSIIGGAKLELTWIGEDGQKHKSPNPDTHINQILPIDLHSYFFFNGERIEKLATLEASSEIKRAIKTMMGLEILERAARHVDKYVLKKFNKKLRDNSTKEQAELIEKKNILAEKVEDTKSNIENNNNNIRHYKTILKDINKKLNEIAEISQLQREREELEAQIDEFKIRISDVKKERLQYISKYGFVAFVEDLTSNAESLLEEKRIKGELPTLIKSKFVDDLLEKGECICGRSLESGSEYYNNVESYKAKATTNDVEDAFIKTSGAVSALIDIRMEVFDRIKEYQKIIKDYETDIKNRNGRLDIISSKLKDHEVEDISRLEDRRDEFLSSIEEEKESIGRLNERAARYTTELDELKQKIDELEIRDAEGQVAKSQIELCEEVKRVIDELHLSLSEKVRQDLSTRVNDTFKSIIRKPYWAEISKDYTLEIYKNVNGNKHLVYDKSTGESQIASLSFIGSLIAIAGERQKEGSDYYKGGVYPIVMDSPYGSLDPEYGGKVADAIPSLAKQVILMATNKQWKGNVEASVLNKVGKDYTLMYHTTEAATDSITRSVVLDSEYEYTEIREGYYE